MEKKVHFTKMQEPTDVDVIVIGAGVAGIAAASTVKAGGKTVREELNLLTSGHGTRSQKSYWWKSLDRCV